MAGMM
jgi:hypothetical protein